MKNKDIVTIPDHERHPHPNRPKRAWKDLHEDIKSKLFLDKKETAIELLKKYPNCSKSSLNNAIRDIWGSQLNHDVLREIMKNGSNKNVSNKKSSMVVELPDFNDQSEEISEPIVKRASNRGPTVKDREEVISLMIEKGFPPDEVAKHCLIMFREPK